MNTTLLPLPPLTPIAAGIKALYKIGGEIDDYIDRHIEELKKSDNPTVCRTGKVLEAAKKGFGVGYISSATIIATGQFLLGNTVLAVQTVATAGTLTNPAVMTCAALGAVLYGYYALDEADRSALNDKLSEGLAIGIQLITSILDFAIKTAKSLLSKQNMAEMKEFISETAAEFGRTLSDVTHKASDKAKEVADAARRKVKAIEEKVVQRLPAVKEKVEDWTDSISDGVDSMVENAKEVRQKVTKRQARNELAELTTIPIAEAVPEAMAPDGKGASDQKG